MSRWESQLEQYFSLLEQIRKDKSRLRFNRSFIIASDIALQYFCEKKIEMMLVQGDIETESKILGGEAHERLLRDIPEIKMRDLWAEIYGKKPILVLEMLVLAHYKGIVLTGRPDSILFTGGVPKMRARALSWLSSLCDEFSGLAKDSEGNLPAFRGKSHTLLQGEVSLPEVTFLHHSR